MPTLADIVNAYLGGGIAPGGLRHSGEGVKGLGYFGALGNANQSSTELSAERDGLEYPLLVPTLSLSELQHLMRGGAPTQDIYDTAESHARSRIKRGLSPFAGPTELRYKEPR